MNLTKHRLRQIIKEEIEAVFINEFIDKLKKAYDYGSKADTLRQTAETEDELGGYGKVLKAAEVLPGIGIPFALSNLARKGIEPWAKERLRRSAAAKKKKEAERLKRARRDIATGKDVVMGIDPETGRTMTARELGRRTQEKALQPPGSRPKPKMAKPAEIPAGGKDYVWKGGKWVEKLALSKKRGTFDEPTGEKFAMAPIKRM